MATQTQAPPPSPTRSGPSTGALVLAGLVVALAGAGLLAGILFATGAIDAGGKTTVRVIERPTATTGAGTDGLDATSVYTAAAPGVVDITAKVVTSGSAQVPDSFAPPQQQEATQSGAGSVLDTAGHILTAEHVVAGARSISVAFQDGATRAAKLLGRDSATDVAVLAVDPKGLTLHPIALGSSAALRVGDPVAMIGTPFGYPRSLSTGVVSGLDRTIDAPNGFTVAHAIQTDGALNPGNSGGPMIDARARQIGIADQIATGDSSARVNTGVGFAVPIDVVKTTLSALERGETPKHAYLGVSTTDATTTNGRSGALVRGVSAGSPAAAAGVETGDVVVAIDGAKVAGTSDLVAAVASKRPGDPITITVLRGNDQRSLRATVGTQPSTAAGG